MAETVARQKFNCSSCGSDVRWSASEHLLVCPYCGTKVAVEDGGDQSPIVEYDLRSSLEVVARAGRGWETEKQSVKCQSCLGVTVLDPEVAAQNCPFCGSAQIVPHDQSERPITPESVLPFIVPEKAVRDIVRKWYGTRWFAPNRLKTSALTDTVKGVYIPYWTFDARADSNWSALSGYHYYITETYTDSNGRTQTRQVQQTRWVPSNGHESKFFDDMLVPATRGVDKSLLFEIEPFPTNKLESYAASYVAGWLVEQYQIDLEAASKGAQSRMSDHMHNQCKSAVPGDTHMNLSVKTAYSDETFKHTLLPIWLLTYNYGRKSYQLLVNGHTGTVAGHRPYSVLKITFVILFGILVGLLIYAKFQSQ